MTMDANGNSHKAAGRPDGGQFDRKAGQGSDDDLEARPAAMDKVALQVSAARAIAGREPPDCSKLGPVGANHTLAVVIHSPCIDLTILIYCKNMVRTCRNINDCFSVKVKSLVIIRIDILINSCRSCNYRSCCINTYSAVSI